ncbi:hypothetical protein ACIPLR_25535 [Herbaspirillum huttiense]|uniref:hypothetical protein n=1 Tax=Herbaspirillum huttiense TaxID=863372 RepID=UPI00381CC93D
MVKKLTAAEIKQQLCDAGYDHVVNVKKTKYPITIRIFQQKTVKQDNVFGCIVSGPEGSYFALRGKDLKPTPVAVMDAVRAAGCEFHGVLRVTP